MDGAQACYLYLTEGVFLFYLKGKLPRVGGRGVFVTKVRPVRATGTYPSADLGGSSKYSNENFED